MSTDLQLLLMHRYWFIVLGSVRDIDHGGKCTLVACCNQRHLQWLACARIQGKLLLPQPTIFQLAANAFLYNVM